MNSIKIEELRIQEAEKHLKICPYCKSARVKKIEYYAFVTYQVVCDCGYYKDVPTQQDTPQEAVESWNKLIKDTKITNREYYNEHFDEFVEIVINMVSDICGPCINCPCNDKCLQKENTDCKAEYRKWLNRKHIGEATTNNGKMY